MCVCVYIFIYRHTRIYMYISMFLDLKNSLVENRYCQAAGSGVKPGEEFNNSTSQIGRCNKSMKVKEGKEIIITSERSEKVMNFRGYQ